MRLAVVSGAVLALVAVAATAVIARVTARVNSAVGQTDLFGPETPSAPASSPTPEPGAGITGPLNILIVGVDTRVSVPDWQPHADSIMIMHVDAGLRQAYLFSLPRDLLVDIPAFADADFSGAHTKLTHAMSYGSYLPARQDRSAAQGFQLLAATVSAYTGIARFDAGAVLTFGGLKRLVDQLGGVDLYVDQTVVSIHMRPDGRSRTLDPSAEHGYRGPQAMYSVGTQHLDGWQALDYARQRYIQGSDYSRQRHQRQLVLALIKKAFARGVVTNVVELDAISTVLGDTLVFDGRGHGVVDYVFALRHLDTAHITLVGLPGGGVYDHGGYRGESLDAVAEPFFAAVAEGSVDEFLTSHPGLINSR